MNRDLDQLSPDEEYALRFVGTAPESAPSGDARERARAAFLTGSAAAKTTGRTDGRVLRFPFERALPLAIAAGVAGLVFWGASPADNWTIISVEGNVTVSGQAADMASVIKSGVVETGVHGTFEARLGEKLRVHITPNSHVELPRGPGRWFGRNRSVSVEQGEFFASTAGHPLGFPLTVETAEAFVHVVGTTFAVRRNDMGTCVCLFEGKVEVSGKRGEDVSVPTGRRARLPRNEDPLVIEPLEAVEASTLQALHERESAAR